MIACPSCQRLVEITEQHYGTLFTCPHCNSVYFIDWGGQPEIAAHEPEAASEEEAPSQDFGSQSGEQPPAEFPQNDFASNDNSQNFGSNDFGGAQGYEQPVQDFSQPVEEPQQDYSGQNYPEQTFEQPRSDEQPAEPSSYDTPAQDAYTSVEPTEAEPAPYDFNKPLDHVEPSAPSIADTSDFSDVTDFANANTVTGPLAYTITIEGIESSQLVNLLKEAMTDSRFAWDVTGHLLRIGGGKLVIEGLNPAKASILVQRLKYLPLKISWRQDVLS